MLIINNKICAQTHSYRNLEYFMDYLLIFAYFCVMRHLVECKSKHVCELSMMIFSHRKLMRSG